MNAPTTKTTANGEAGFGVIEIAMVIAIGGIITAMSILAFGKAASKYQLRQKAQNIAIHIERARSLAIKYNQTLTLGFTSQNQNFGLTCADCAEAKGELQAMTLPSDVALSSFPGFTLKGNGTISTTPSTSTITLTDRKSGRQVDMNISNSGRVTVGDVSDN